MELPKPFPCGHPSTPPNAASKRVTRKLADGKLRTYDTRTCMTCERLRSRHYRQSNAPGIPGAVDVPTDDAIAEAEALLGCEEWG